MEIDDILGEWIPDDWEQVGDAEDEIEPTETARKYIDSLADESGLHLRKPDETKAAYKAHSERGLFGLFVTEKLKSAWRTWTNSVLVGKGERSVTIAELDAYIGLEMAMSLIPITDIKEFWSDKKFQGHADFKDTMSRNRFQAIRGSFQIHPAYESNEDELDTADCSDTEEAIAAAHAAATAQDIAAAAAAEADVVAAAGIADATVSNADRPTDFARTVAIAAAKATAATTAVEADTAAVAVGLAISCGDSNTTPRGHLTDAPSIRLHATGNTTGAPPQGALQGPSAEEVARQDPLRHSRLLLEHFQRKFATFAVPIGVSSVDEIGVRTKARTLAKSFMPLKPDKFAIRFYAVVGWKSLYVHSLWDNGSGNTMPTTPVQRYTKLFPSLRLPLRVTLNREDINIKLESATALWMTMIAHQTKLCRADSGRRLIVSDNFYTRHNLAKAILAMTDGEVRMLGTVRKDWVGHLNATAVTDSISRVSQMTRGSWELIAAVDSGADSKQARDAHTRQQKKLPLNLRTKYSPPVELSDKAGFIVFLDKRPVIFYTNDLARTPSARVLGGDTSEAIACCHGLYPIRRWTGSEVMHRKIIMAPAIVAAYNTAMNGVDRVDQLRSTNPTRRKEIRLSMSLFTWILDLSVINAFALMKHIETKPNAPQTLREFKRRVCESLTAAQCAMKKRKEVEKKRARPESHPNITPDGNGFHMLTPNSRENSSGKLVCHLCSLQDIKSSKSRFGCTKCLVGYHVACFAVAHYRDQFHNPTASVAKALQALSDADNGKAPSKTRRRLNNSTTALENLTLPN